VHAGRCAKINLFSNVKRIVVYLYWKSLLSMEEWESFWTPRGPYVHDGSVFILFDSLHASTVFFSDKSKRTDVKRVNCLQMVGSSFFCITFFFICDGGYMRLVSWETGLWCSPKQVVMAAGCSKSTV
jgi:hypothetical protein